MEEKIPNTIETEVNEGAAYQQAAWELKELLFHLEQCEALIVPCYFLNRENYDHYPGLSSYDDEDTIRTPARAKQLAEARVDRAFKEAKEKMEQQISSVGGRSFYKDYCARVSDWMDQLNLTLNSLCSEKNAPVIREMRQHASKSAVLDKAREVGDTLFSRYSLSSPKSYYSRIEYLKDERSDSGDSFLYRMVAKAFTQYGYNCYEAISAIESDIDRNVTAFGRDFHDQMKRYVLSNVVEPIRQLNASL